MYCVGALAEAPHVSVTLSPLTLAARFAGAVGATARTVAILLTAMISAAAATRRVEPAKGSALDTPKIPWLVDSISLARSARRGPLHGAQSAVQRVQDSRCGPSSGPT